MCEFFSFSGLFAGRGYTAEALSGFCWLLSDFFSVLFRDSLFSFNIFSLLLQVLLHVLCVYFSTPFYGCSELFLEHPLCIFFRIFSSFGPCDLTLFRQTRRTSVRNPTGEWHSCPESIRPGQCRPCQKNGRPPCFSFMLILYCEEFPPGFPPFSPGTNQCECPFRGRTRFPAHTKARQPAFGYISEVCFFLFIPLKQKTNTGSTSGTVRGAISSIFFGHRK